MGPIYTQPTLSVLKHAQFRDRGATLRLGVGVRGGGAPLVTRYGGGGTKHLFLLILYNFKNIGGTCPPGPLLRGPCNFWLQLRTYIVQCPIDVPIEKDGV